MRVPRVLLIALPFLLGACGVIAGLDGYSESDNLTTDGGGNNADATASGNTDGGPTGNADGRSLVPDDSGIVILEAASDAPLAHDTGPASDAACQLTKNGGGCNGNAASCCSDICDETGTCNGNQCTANGMTCSNKLVLVVNAPPYYRAQGPCCVKQFCNPKSGETQSGFCAPCIAKGQPAPARTMSYFDIFSMSNKQAPVYYDDACCSGSQDTTSGNCN